MKRTVIMITSLIMASMLSGCDVSTVSDVISGPGKAGPVMNALSFSAEKSGSEDESDDKLSAEDIPGLITEEAEYSGEDPASVNTADGSENTSSEAGGNASDVSGIMSGLTSSAADSGSGNYTGSGSSAETVTVSGKYIMYSTPDKAEVRIGVHTREADAATAQQANTQTVDNVIQALKDLGTDEKSIQTTGYNIWQEYNYETNEVRGYNVTTSLTIKDLDIADAGAVISEAIAAGANEMNGISYSCSDYDKVYEDALSAAVDAAYEKGVVLAEAAGRELGGVQTIVEGYQDMNARYSRSDVTMDAVEEKALGAAAASVMPGEAEIAAEVTVTYYLK